MAHSTSQCDETLSQKAKVMAPMAHSQDGTSSKNIDETKTKAAKRMTPMAHSMPGTTSHEEETLTKRAKVKPSMVTMS